MNSDIKLKDKTLILEGTTLKIEVDSIGINNHSEESLSVLVDDDKLLNLAQDHGGEIAVFGNLTVTGGELVMRKDNGKPILSIEQKGDAALLELDHEDGGDGIKIDAKKGMISIRNEDGDITILPAEINNLKQRVSNLEDKIDEIQG